MEKFRPLRPKLLSKTSYLLGLQCPLRLWRHAQRIPETPPDEPPFDAAEDFAEEAERVEALARGLIGPDAPFQVELETPDCRAVADFLIPEAAGHRLIEVKASGEVKHLHLRDLAYQWAVAEAAGKPIHAAEIVHVDKTYLRGADEVDPAALLKRVDVTEDVRRLLPQTREDIARLLPILRAKSPPVAQPGRRCKGNRSSQSEVRPSDCGHLQPGALCSIEVPFDWAERLPNLRGKARAAVDALPEPRHTQDLDLAADFWSPEQRRLILCNRQGEAIVELDGLEEAIAAFLQGPTTYLDFEYDPFVAIPRFEGTRPFQRLPFQWAMSRSDRPGEDFAFLATDQADPRRAFIESLLEALPATGPIITYYAAAETTVLKYYLEDWFGGEYAARVQNVLLRILDLYQLVKGHYGHPAMMGSFSLKRVAPAMLGRGYEDLPVSDGMAAVRGWRRLASGSLPSDEAEALRRDLLAYCGRDASLMSDILQHLAQALRGTARSMVGRP